MRFNPVLTTKILTPWWIAFVAAIICMVGTVTAQCDGQWLPGDTVPGLDRWVRATVVTTNGDIIVGGRFFSAGGVELNHVARWDGGTWSPLGAGVSGGDVRHLAVHDGEIIAAGDFTSAGGVPAFGIAR